MDLRRQERWHGVEEVDPFFHVEVENFYFSYDSSPELRQRQKKVSGAVWSVGGRNRDDLIVLPDLEGSGIASLRNPTFGIAGHLMAAMLTGVDEPGNLVPVSKNTNDKMSVVEREIANNAANPHWLEIEIPDYYDEPDLDSRVPKRFLYKLYGGHQAPKRGEDPVITREVVQDWLQVGNYGLPQRSVTRAAQLQNGLALGWRIEDVSATGNPARSFNFLRGHLPPPNNRPLAFLDYWLIAYQGLREVAASEIVQYMDSIALNAGFGPWARNFAIRGNILANNNKLISNVYGKRETVVDVPSGIVIEQYNDLMSGGGLNAPHVDHIVPESQDGPNCFSNAQITSLQYNVQKGNNTKQLEFRTDQWKEDMAKRVASDPLVKKW